MTTGLVGLCLWLLMVLAYVRAALARPDDGRDALFLFSMILGVAEAGMGVAFPSLSLYVTAAALSVVGRLASNAPHPRQVSTEGSEAN